MKENDLHLLTIVEQAELIKQKQLSPVELLDSYMKQIHTHEPEIQAFVTLTLESAATAAKKAEYEITKGNYKGKLHGIPYGVKDIIWTNGVVTKGGSNVFPNFVPEENATVIQKLEDAGAIVLGKTTTTEFAYQGGEPPTRNPWNLRLTPGGSSSGSAAAISGNMAAFSLGTQTYGSLIRPASYNGLTCMKPSFGRVSRYGVYIASWSLDHIGAFTRSVADQAIVLEAMNGFDYRDPHTIAGSQNYAEQLRHSNIKGLRIGIPNEYFEAEDEAITKVHNDAVNQFTAMGAQIKVVKIPEMISVADAAHKMIMRAEGAEFHADRYEERKERYGPNMREQLELGREMKAIDFIHAQRVRTIFRQELMEMFQDIDLLLTPATIHLPGEGYKTGNPKFNGPFTNSGLPAMTIPAGFHEPSGVPIGIQLVAPLYREEVLLTTGLAFQSVTDFHKLRVCNAVKIES